MTARRAIPESCSLATVGGRFELASGIERRYVWSTTTWIIYGPNGVLP